LDNMIIKTHPKINISLDVLSKRPDGYHEVRMVMQSLAIYDTVGIELTNGNEISIESNVKYIPNDQSNIAYKAAALFIEYFNIKNTGVKIFIEKNIPVAAGMAGGSCNAAGVLRALNSLTGINCDEKTLMEIGMRIGADVPYCIYGKTALAEGIGEIITPLKLRNRAKARFLFLNLVELLDDNYTSRLLFFHPSMQDLKYKLFSFSL